MRKKTAHKRRTMPGARKRHSVDSENDAHVRAGESPSGSRPERRDGFNDAGERSLSFHGSGDCETKSSRDPDNESGRVPKRRSGLLKKRRNSAPLKMTNTSSQATNTTTNTNTKPSNTNAGLDITQSTRKEAQRPTEARCEVSEETKKLGRSVKSGRKRRKNYGWGRRKSCKAQEVEEKKKSSSDDNSLNGSSSESGSSSNSDGGKSNSGSDEDSSSSGSCSSSEEEIDSSRPVAKGNHDSNKDSRETRGEKKEGKQKIQITKRKRRLSTNSPFLSRGNRRRHSLLKNHSKQDTETQLEAEKQEAEAAKQRLVEAMQREQRRSEPDDVAIVLQSKPGYPKSELECDSESSSDSSSESSYESDTSSTSDSDSDSKAEPEPETKPSTDETESSQNQTEIRPKRIMTKRRSDEGLFAAKKRKRSALDEESEESSKSKTEKLKKELVKEDNAYFQTTKTTKRCGVKRLKREPIPKGAKCVLCSCTAKKSFRRATDYNVKVLALLGKQVKPNDALCDRCRRLTRQQNLENRLDVEVTEPKVHFTEPPKNKVKRDITPIETPKTKSQIVKSAKPISKPTNTSTNTNKKLSDLTRISSASTTTTTTIVPPTKAGRHPICISCKTPPPSQLPDLGYTREEHEIHERLCRRFAEIDAQRRRMMRWKKRRFCETTSEYFCKPCRSKKGGCEMGNKEYPLGWTKILEEWEKINLRSGSVDDSGEELREHSPRPPIRDRPRAFHEEYLDPDLAEEEKESWDRDEEYEVERKVERRGVKRSGDIEEEERWWKRRRARGWESHDDHYEAPYVAIALPVDKLELNTPHDPPQFQQPSISDPFQSMDPMALLNLPQAQSNPFMQAVSQQFQIQHQQQQWIQHLLTQLEQQNQQQLQLQQLLLQIQQQGFNSTMQARIQALHAPLSGPIAGPLLASPPQSAEPFPSFHQHPQFPQTSQIPTAPNAQVALDITPLYELPHYHPPPIPAAQHVQNTSDIRLLLDVPSSLPPTDYFWDLG